MSICKDNSHQYSQDEILILAKALANECSTVLCSNIFYLSNTLQEMEKALDAYNYAVECYEKKNK